MGVEAQIPKSKIFVLWFNVFNVIKFDEAFKPILAKQEG